MVFARLRDENLIDDRPALADLGETDPDYRNCSAGWASDTGYTWAVCEPTTGELLAEVTLDPVTATLHTRARDVTRRGSHCGAVGPPVRRGGARYHGLD